MSIFYRYKNSAEAPSELRLNAPSAPVETVKEWIKRKEQLTNTELQIFNAQTNKEYPKGASIPRQTYLIVKRAIPSGDSHRQMGQQIRANLNRNNQTQGAQPIQGTSGIPKSMLKTVRVDELQNRETRESGSLVVANEEGELQELNPIRDVFRENRSQAAPDRDEQRKALWRRFKVEDYDPDLVPTVSRKVATELLPEKGYICPSCAKRVSIDGLEECPELQNKAKRWLEEQKEVAQRQTTNSHNAGHSEQGEEEFSPEPVENDIYALLGGPSPYENTKQDSTAENPVTESNEAKVTVKQNDLRTDYTTTTSASLSVPSGSSTGSGTNVTSATTHSTGSTQGNSLLPYPYHARPPIRPPPRGYPWGGRPMYHPEMQRPIYPRHPYDMYGGGYMYAQPPFMPPRAPIRPSMQPNASSAYYHASSGGSDNSRRNSGRCSRSRSRSNSRPNNRGSESHRSSRSRSREHSRHSSSNIRSESRSQSRQGSENSGGRSNRGRGGGRGRSRGNRNKGKKHSDDGGRMISHKLDRSS